MQPRVSWYLFAKSNFLGGDIAPIPPSPTTNTIYLDENNVLYLNNNQMGYLN